MGVAITFKTESQVDYWAKDFKRRVSDGETPTIEEVEADRSLNQNDMSFEIYKRIAQQLYGGDVSHARAECKLRHGIPILRTEKPAFRAAYDKHIKPLCYEDKLCLLYTSPSPRDLSTSRMPSSA